MVPLHSWSMSGRRVLAELSCDSEVFAELELEISCKGWGILIDLFLCGVRVIACMEKMRSYVI